MSVRRWSALGGVVASLILAATVVARNSAPPETRLSPQVRLYYSDNALAHQSGAVAVLVAALLLVLFGARLWALLDAGDRETRMLAVAVFGGATLTAATLLAAAATHLALTDAAQSHLPILVRTFNLLDHYALLAVGFGLAAMFLPLGIALVRRPVLPRAAGWLALVVAALSVAGPLGVAGLIGAAIWIFLVGGQLLIKDTLPSETATVRKVAWPADAAQGPAPQ